MALSADKKAMLRTWAAAGDIAAIEALGQEATGRAGFLLVGAPAAPAVAVHAAIAGNTSVVPVTAGLTNPVVPRSVDVVFAASYDGGNVVVTGTNQYGKAVSETFVAVAGTTVAGTKIFKTVTSVEHLAVGATANTYTTQTGSKLGLMVDVLDSFGVGMVDGVPEKVTMDSVNEAVTFTTAPNGTRVLSLMMNL
jgi:hypothetical protein